MLAVIRFAHARASICASLPLAASSTRRVATSAHRRAEITQPAHEHATDLDASDGRLAATTAGAAPPTPSASNPDTSSPAIDEPSPEAAHAAHVTAILHALSQPPFTPNARAVFEYNARPAVPPSSVLYARGFPHGANEGSIIPEMRRLGPRIEKVVISRTFRPSSPPVSRAASRSTSLCFAPQASRRMCSCTTRTPRTPP
jgi:hypothetical protein